MKYPTRIYYTEADKGLMWDRWEKGESLNAIARHFGRSHSSIQGILSRTGGIRPPQRQRSQRALTLAEREEISRGVVAGLSLRSIAALLGRAPSTVTREIKRNGGRRRYRANSAKKSAGAGVSNTSGLFVPGLVILSRKACRPIRVPAVPYRWSPTTECPNHARWARI